MNAIQLLIGAHQHLAERLEPTADGATPEDPEALARRLGQDWSDHARLEEGSVFWIIRERGAATRYQVDAARERHHAISHTLTDLERLLGSARNPHRAERLESLVDRLRGQIGLHLTASRRLFVAMRAELSVADLEAIGVAIVQAQAKARTHRTWISRPASGPADPGS